MGQKSKTQNVTKVKNSKLYKTQQLKYKKNTKKLNVTKLKTVNLWQTLLYWIVREKKPHKLEILRKNLNLKLLQNSKTLIVTTLKSLNWYKVQLKPKKKTQAVTKLNNSSYDEAQQLK